MADESRNIKSNVVLVLAGFIINIVMVYFTGVTDLPVYMDSIGTILAAVLGGVLPGITVGYFSNIINYFFSISHDPLTLYYGFISVLIAVAAVFLANKGLFRKWQVTVISVFIFAFIGGGLGSILTWILYGFNFGSNVSSNLVMDIYDFLNCCPFIAQLLGDYCVDFVDKGVSVIIAGLVIRFLPENLLLKFKYGCKYAKNKIEESNESDDIVCRQMSLRTRLLIIIVSSSLVMGLAPIIISMYINGSHSSGLAGTDRAVYFIETFSLLFGIGIIIVAYVFWFYEQQILKPIRVLMLQTKEAGRTDVKIGDRVRDKMQVNTGDELEILFNSMCDAEDSIIHFDIASKSKTAFLSKLSHEIRTPLNSVIGFSNIALNDKQTVTKEELLDYMTKIQISGNYLLELVSDVLDISRIEEGRMSVSNEACRLDDIVEEVVNAFQGQMKNKNIEFVVDKDYNTDMLLFMDYFHTVQILNNLISNACKYTEEGGVVGFEVHGRIVGKKKAEVTYIVQDTGIGMSEEFQKRIFEPFTQDERGRKMKNQLRGSGLGMSICKSIVELLGGKIELQSEIGEGTCFTVTITHELIGNARTNGTEKEDLSVFEGKKILVVDDIELNRIVIEKSLSSLKLEFVEAETGLEALQKYEASSAGEFFAVFMDVQMPEMNGIEATRKIREHKDRADYNIPIIGMTADAFSDDIEKAKANGMDDYVTKPIDVNKVIKILLGLVDTKKS